MKKPAVIILLGIAAVGCNDNDNNNNGQNSLFPTFDGTTGATWEMMATATGDLEGLQSYVPVNFDSIVNVNSIVQIYDIATDSWSDAASAGPDNAPWLQAAPVGDDLWLIKENNIYKYVLATDTWTTEATWIGNDEFSMTESDEHGVIYAHSSDDNFVIYDTNQPPGATNPSYFDASVVVTSTFETRLAYDPGTRSIFFGGYGDPELYQWEIDAGTVTQVTSIPENQLNDIFCSDRSGHIYAAGDSGGTTMFQYDIATDTWSQIPDLPVDHGNNWTCTVDAGGRYLYTSADTQFYRLPLN